MEYFCMPFVWLAEMKTQLRKNSCKSFADVRRDNHLSDEEIFYSVFSSHWPQCFLDSCADVILGTYKEGGATTFWSYTVNLPLSSNSMVSWKFCYLLHKVLRGGHRNVWTQKCKDSPALFLTTSIPNVPVSVWPAGCSRFKQPLSQHQGYGHSVGKSTLTLPFQHITGNGASFPLVVATGKNVSKPLYDW